MPDSYTMNEAMSYLRCCYAGAAAEALYRGLSIEHPLVAEGCVSDMARADRCISEFSSPADKFRKRLHKETREKSALALCSCDQGREAIEDPGSSFDDKRSRAWRHGARGVWRGVQHGAGRCGEDCSKTTRVRRRGMCMLTKNAGKTMNGNRAAVPLIRMQR